MMEHYTAVQTRELQIHITTWMNFSNVILSKKKQLVEDYIIIPFVKKLQNKQN